MTLIHLTNDEYTPDRYDALADDETLLVELMHDDGSRSFIFGTDL